MKSIIRIVTVLGLLISGVYTYINEFAFEGVVAFLSFLVAFLGTFIFSKTTKMNQIVGSNSEAYQSGRDINIRE
ncbi:MAG TPA: hypothetical protein VK021_00080 [Flavobacteriaceae bacterium]|nr:hypothetical protein [Flavobacteriaceae bacterium]